MLTGSWWLKTYETDAAIAAKCSYPNACFTRVMAGCVGFFTFSQFGDVPIEVG
jgi:hypothetical protein